MILFGYSLVNFPLFVFCVVILCISLIHRMNRMIYESDAGTGINSQNYLFEFYIQKTVSTQTLYCYMYSFQYDIGIIIMIMFAVGPRSVGLSWEVWPISAGRETLLSCSSSGSSPPATITWWREGKLLGLIDQQVSQS